MCSSKKEVEQKKRLDDLTVSKINYLKEALKLNYTHEEMGRNIGISESAARNMINRSK